MGNETKPAAAKPAADKPAAEAKVKPAYALHRINGKIEPGTMFRPTSATERDELVNLEAIRDLNEAEALVFEKTEGAAPAPDADPLG